MPRHFAAGVAVGPSTLLLPGMLALGMVASVVVARLLFTQFGKKMPRPTWRGVDDEITADCSSTSSELAEHMHARLTAERALKKLREELDRGVEERTLALRIANEGLVRDEASLRQSLVFAERARAAAESASRAKSEFLAKMSHEIRTPLNGLVGVMELLLGTALDDHQRQFVEIVQNSGNELTKIVDDILDFSKLEAHKLEIESVELNLQAIVDEAVLLMTHHAARKGIKIESILERDVPRLLRGDPGRVKQVLVNLLSNAIKFTEAGSIRIWLSVASQQDGKIIARFAVTDTGIGIPPDRMDRLFKDYSQVDASTARRYGGTGLGLSIARQLVELMGGTIGAESVCDQGSRFWFTTSFQSVQSAPRVPQLTSASGSVLRVLMVESGPFMGESLRRQIGDCGLEAEVVSGGEQALHALFDAVRLDKPFRFAVINEDLPGMSGTDLGRSIKRVSMLANTSLLLICPLERVFDSSQLERAGFFDRLTTPVQQSELHRSFTNELASAIKANSTSPVDWTPSSTVFAEAA